MYKLLIKAIVILGVTVSFLACNKATESNKEVKINFDENWESLSTINREPEWFKDAKFGIYFHWGVYSVPAFSSEWYPRWMYVPGREEWGGEVYGHHKETHGPLTEFNYHDFIPMFTAEHFDAREWADLFKESGAKFAGPVAQHHDGFAMWASKVNPWNANDMGPNKDILGELFAELKANEMKTIATFHHARLLQRYAQDTSNWAGNSTNPGWDSHYPYHPDYVTSSSDPKFSKLYGNIPEDEFHDYWLNQVKEVVDGYGPDIIWFDSWLDKIPEDYRQKMVAHHFNTAISRDQEPIVAYKQEDIPANVGILDIEQGGKTDLSDDYWLTDITLSYGSWCYVTGQTYKPAPLVIRNMIDVWSKKGIVLLNISPKADGTIPEGQRVVLKAIGQWMNKHKEAIYGTRAYSIFGYGEAEFEKGHFGGQSATISYSEKDFRFTTSNDEMNLYVFSLGLPKPDSDIEIRNINQINGIKRVSVVGSGTELKWSVTDEILTLSTPGASEMDETATVFKIEFE